MAIRNKPLNGFESLRRIHGTIYWQYSLTLEASLLIITGQITLTHMKRLYILILIIGQALALTAWASSPVINEQGTESAHMHIDEHHYGMKVHDSDDHEHGESCHLHLSVQLNNTGSLTVHANPSKSIQNSHVTTFISRVLTGPPTPPPTA